MTQSVPSPDDRPFAPPVDQQPVDQQPVDQQPVPQRPPEEIEDSDCGEPTSLRPQLPGAGDLSTGLDGPAMAARPVGAPLIPPLETTSPADLVEPESKPSVQLHAQSGVQSHAQSTTGATHPQPIVQSRAQSTTGATPEVSEFVPLRVDPPPSLTPTLLLRSTLLLVSLAAPISVLWFEYNGAAGDVRSSVPVIGLHLGVGVLIVLWSLLAMGNAARVVPPSRYTHESRGSIAVVLWLLAVAAPVGAIAVSGRLRDRLADPEDLAAAFSMAAILLIVSLLMWLPFRYHARQATRVGAPHRAMFAWFFAPLIAAVGGVAAIPVGLGDMLEENGLSAADRVVKVLVAYALPMLVFALSTWRAITVFDEVIDLRWRRWRTEWEQTLGRLAEEPLPGPEDSPNIDGLINR